MTWRVEERPADPPTHGEGQAHATVVFHAPSYWLTDGSQSFRMLSKAVAEALAAYLNAGV